MNSVELIGVTKEKIDNLHRYIEYNLPSNNEEDKESQQIVARYWCNYAKNVLNSLNENRTIAIRGHLDACEKFGTILVVETIDLLN